MTMHDYGEWPSPNLHTHLDIYYQNVYGIKTKASEVLAYVCTFNFHVICLTKMWLTSFCFNCNFFLDPYLVYRASRISAEKAHGGGALNAVSDSVSGTVRGTDLELAEEWVWLKYCFLMAVIFLSATTVLCVAQLQTHLSGILAT
jgi:hypothetical protein